MAARSGAGTGVIVSLVVFVITTIFMLVFAIVFYSGQQKALQEKAAAEKGLNQYARAAERNADWMNEMEAAASAEARSVVGLAQEQLRTLRAALGGNPDSTTEAVLVDLQAYEVSPNRSAAAALADMHRDLNNCRSTLQSKDSQAAELQTQITNLFATLEGARQAHQQEMQNTLASIEDYRLEAERLRTDVAEKLTWLEQVKDELEREFANERDSLNNQIDAASQENVVLASRIKEIEARLAAIRIKPTRPDELVDGHVIDSTGTNDQIFIDRGRQHHIVLGMTFEVYDNAAALSQVDPRTGQLPQGKASLLVHRVGDTTSTARITRNVPGRPVVRGDVIANAIYDPTYKFKLLVHGIFDTNNDGRPTEDEAIALRNQIVEWGGIVVEGDQLPGDLDFLVLGEEPPLAAPPPPGAQDWVIHDYVRKRQAREKYLQLKQQAMDAQIPILNANRFFILTGQTVR